VGVEIDSKWFQKEHLEASTAALAKRPQQDIKPGANPLLKSKRMSEHVVGNMTPPTSRPKLDSKQSIA
jgi:hypothetical protein